MKKIVLALAAAASLAAALPAAAQPHFRADHNTGASINQREAQITQRIAMGQRNGAISFREARSLKVQLAQIESLEQRYRRGGLNGWETADLNRRLDRLSGQVFAERHDRDNRRY